MYPRKQKNVVLVRIIGETMIQVGDLIRIHAMNRKYYGSELSQYSAGVWLVIRVDDLTSSCQAIKGNKKEWFDLNHVWAVQHD